MLVTDDAALRASLTRLKGYIEQIARVESVDVVDSTAPRPSQAATTVEAGIGIIIPMEGLIDVEAERQRITKELQKVEKDIGFFEGRLANERFVASAPQALLDEARGKLAAVQEARTRLLAGLEKLGGS
jgi:valyl-tRNA synthetase